MLSQQDLELRAKLWNEVTDSIKNFLDQRGYISVQTPLIVSSPGMEPNLDPLAVEVRHLTHGGEVKHRAALITSPEYSMKKLLGAGMKKIYCLTPVFRNMEKMGERWSVEFSMLEWYQQGLDYTACMQETEELVKVVLEGHAVASNVERRTSNVADLSSLTSHQPATGEPWPRISYVKEFTARFGVHPDQASADQLIKLCGQHNVQAGSTEPEHEMIDRLFNAVMMPELMLKHVQFFLCEYPVKCASLARRSSDGAYAERFEGYVQGLEICNGFTELVDEQEQRLRFAAEAEERRLAGKTVYPIDEELLFGLASIASPTYGNALGVDRLVMLKAGVKDIDSIHLFPPSQRF